MSFNVEVLRPGLLPPKCPSSHPCTLCHLASHHPHLLWTHIQVSIAEICFSLPVFNLSPLSALTRSTSLRTPMSGSTSSIPHKNDFKLLTWRLHHQLYRHHPDRAALRRCPHPPHGYLGQEATDGEDRKIVLNFLEICNFHSHFKTKGCIPCPAWRFLHCCRRS